MARLRFGGMIADDDPDLGAAIGSFIGKGYDFEPEEIELPDYTDIYRLKARRDDYRDFIQAREEQLRAAEEARQNAKWEKDQLAREEQFSRDEARREVDRTREEDRLDKQFFDEQKAREKQGVDLEGQPIAGSMYDLENEAETRKAARAAQAKAAAEQQAREARAVTAYEKSTKITKEDARTQAREAAAAAAELYGWDEDQAKAMVPVYQRQLEAGQAVTIGRGQTFRAGKSRKELEDAVNAAYAGEESEANQEARAALGLGPKKPGRKALPIVQRPGIRVPQPGPLTPAQREVAGGSPEDIDDLAEALVAKGYTPENARLAARNMLQSRRWFESERERLADDAQRKLDEERSLPGFLTSMNRRLQAAAGGDMRAYSRAVSSAELPPVQASSLGPLGDVGQTVANTLGAVKGTLLDAPTASLSGIPGMKFEDLALSARFGPGATIMPDLKTAARLGAASAAQDPDLQAALLSQARTGASVEGKIARVAAMFGTDPTNYVPFLNVGLRGAAVTGILLPFLAERGVQGAGQWVMDFKDAGYKLTPELVDRLPETVVAAVLPVLGAAGMRSDIQGFRQGRALDRAQGEALAFDSQVEGVGAGVEQAMQAPAAAPRLSPEAPRQAFERDIAERQGEFARPEAERVAERDRFTQDWLELNPEQRELAVRMFDPEARRAGGERAVTEAGGDLVEAALNAGDPTPFISRMTQEQRAELNRRLDDELAAQEADAELQGSPEAPRVAEIGATIEEGMQAPPGAPRPGRRPTENAPAEPSPAQMEAGNYKKGHRKVQGLDISVETPKGGVRTAKDGSWKVEDFPADYGYIKRTEGADGDHVDVYLGDATEAGTVFIVDQLDADTGRFDEHKVMMGFPDERAAVETYRRGFSDGRADERIGAVTPMSMDEFKAWLKKGDTTKPVAERSAAEPNERPLTAAEEATLPQDRTPAPWEQDPDFQAAVAESGGRRESLLGRFVEGAKEGLIGGAGKGEKFDITERQKRGREVETFPVGEMDRVYAQEMASAVRALIDRHRAEGGTVEVTPRGVEVMRLQNGKSLMRRGRAAMIVNTRGEVTDLALESYGSLGGGRDVVRLADEIAASGLKVSDDIPMSEHTLRFIEGLTRRRPVLFDALPPATRESILYLRGANAERAGRGRTAAIEPRGVGESVLGIPGAGDRGVAGREPAGRGGGEPSARSEVGAEAGGGRVVPPAQEGVRRRAPLAGLSGAEVDGLLDRLGPTGQAIKDSLRKIGGEIPRTPGDLAEIIGREAGSASRGVLVELTSRAVVHALDQLAPGTAHAFTASVPPGTIAVAVNALARHAITEGLHLGMHFREWAPRQIARFGDAVRPVLRRAWEQARNVLAQAKKLGGDAVQMVFGGPTRRQMAPEGGKGAPPSAADLAVPAPKKGIPAFDAAHKPIGSFRRALTPYLEVVKGFEAVRGGVKVGEQFAERLTSYINQWERRGSRDFADFWKATRDLAKNEQDQLVRILDEGPATVPEASPRAKAAAAQVRSVLDQIADRAREARVFAGRLENYFPHKFENRWQFEHEAELAAQKTFEEAGGTAAGENWLDKNGHTLSPFEIAEKVNEAAAQMAKVHYDVRSYNRRQKNLEYHRDPEGRTDYRRDLGVLGEYVLEGNRRIAEANELGPKLERVREQLYQMSPERGERDYAMTGLLRMTGREQRNWMHTYSDVLRKFSAVTKLGFGAFNQLGSLANTVTHAGLRPTLKAIAEVGLPGTKAFKEARYNALKSGALFHNISNEIMTTWGTGPSKHAKWNVAGRAYDVAAKHLWGVPHVDAYMRVVAGAAAKHAIPAMVRAGDWKGLRKMELEPDVARKVADVLQRGGELTPVMQRVLERAEKRLSEKSQYRTGIAEMPLWSTSPAGRLLTQFMPFMYQHFRAIKGLKENHEWGALASYVAASVAVGEVAASLKSMAQGYGMKGEPPNDQEGFIRWVQDIFANRRVQADFDKPGSLAWRAAQDFLYSGGIGILQTIFERAARMRSLADIAGPAVGDLDKVLSAANAAAGGNLRPAGKAAAEMLIPGFGSQIGTEFLRDPKTEAKSPAWWPGWVGRSRDLLAGDTDLEAALAGGTVGGAENLSPVRQAQREYVMERRQGAGLRREAEEEGLTPSGRKPKKSKPRLETWREKAERRRRLNERLRRRLEAGQ